ncbi:PAS domain S-box protein [Uliginosibacterium gangwonense]|uniref:PAS domain S-box protein n=1 Tax=Uliginosibacterium gangwonense TaxID=392736 RepID=UPI001469F7BB|nr:PAS domain S-box protein [Uliginosibacterium gangwonense]
MNFSTRIMKWLRYPLVSWGVLLLTLGLTLLSAWYSQQAIKARARERFTFQADATANAVMRHIQEYETLLQSAAGLVQSQSPHNIPREKWAHYVGQLQLPVDHPEILGLGYIESLPAQAGAELIARMQSEGFADYYIHPGGQPAELAVVTRIEPFNWSNRQLLGRNMLATPALREAMEQARDTGAITASEPTLFDPETGRTPQEGIILFHAIYRNGQTPASTEQRRAALMGYVFGHFRPRDLISRLMNSLQDGLSLQIEDLNTAPNANPAGMAETEPPLFETWHHMSIGNKIWSLHLYSLPSLFSTEERKLPWIITGAGGMIAILLYLVLSRMSDQRRRAEVLAEDITKELLQSESRYRAVFEHSNSVMLLIDPDTTTIIDGNLAAQHFYGYTRAQFKGMPIGTINPNPLEQIQYEIAQALSNRRDCFYLAHRLADGNIRQVEVRSVTMTLEGRSLLYAVINDITERQASEWQRILMGFAINHMDEAMYLLDASSHFTYVNAACSTQLGYTREQLLGMSIAQITPDWNEDYWAKLRNDIQIEGARILESQHRRQDGGTFPVEISANHFEYNNNSYTLMLVRDISERKKLETELAAYRDRLEQQVVEETSKFRALVEQSIVGIYIIQDNDFVYVNPGLASMLGYSSPEEIIGKLNVLDLIAPEDADRIQGGWQHYIEANMTRMHFGVALHKADGSPIMVEAHSRLTQYQGRPAIIGVAIDVTETRRSQAELESLVAQKAAALAHSEILMRSAIETIGEAFVIFNTEDRLIFCNEKYREMYQLPVELVDTHPTFEDILRYRAQYEPRGMSTEELDAWIAECKRSHDVGDMDLLQKTGYGNWIRIKERRTANGHIVGFRVDVSELEHAREAAEAASRAKSNFLATMSHEIRTPMNSILGMAQLLLMPGIKEGEVEKYAEIIYNSGQTLLALLNDILDLSKVEAGRMELDRVAFSPEHIINDIVSLFAPAAREKDLVLHSTLKLKPGRCWGDPLRLRQVLSNLVSNAVKFTHTGSISLCVEDIPAEKETLRRLHFSIEDTGIGVATDKQSKLFELFSQVDSSITRRFGGSGLGLAITRRLVELMGGSVGMRSVEGQGSCFWFEVPLEYQGADTENKPLAAALTSPAPSGPLTASPARAKHILVVEDTPANILLIRALLTRSGYQVSCVTDGAQAIAALCKQTDRPDAVLMDCQMPVMDGLEATRQVRLWEKDNPPLRVPIIALTAGAFEEDRARCLAAGMDDFLAKPVDIHTLLPTLDRWLSSTLVSNPSDPEASVINATPASTFEVNFDEALERLDQSEETLVMYTSLVRKQIDEDLATLTHACTLHNLVQIKKTSHKLAGSLAGLCAPQAVQLCKALEIAAKTGSGVEAENYLSQLEEALQAVIPQLDAFLAGRHKGIPNPPPSESA